MRKVASLLLLLGCSQCLLGVSVSSLTNKVSQAVQQYVGENIKTDDVLRARVLAHPHLVGLLQTHVDSVTVAAANATAAAGTGTFYGSEVVNKAQMHAEVQAERAGALDKARQVLNNMMKETSEQKDMTNEQCDRYRDETQEQLDLAHQGKAQCESGSAKATSGLNQVSVLNLILFFLSSLD